MDDLLRAHAIILCFHSVTTESHAVCCWGAQKLVSHVAFSGHLAMAV